MSDPITILGIAGSLRTASYNRAALRAAQRLAPDGTVFKTFDIAALPIYNQDDEQQPTMPVVELKRSIRAADAILIASPEYNYSVPGGLKNAIDWASRPYGDNAWKGKPVALIGVSVGKFGAIRAQYHLRQMFVFLDMHAVNQPEVAIGNAAEAFSDDGELRDPSTRTLIGELLAGLVKRGRELRASQASRVAKPASNAQDAGAVKAS